MPSLLAESHDSLEDSMADFISVKSYFIRDISSQWHAFFRMDHASFIVKIV